MFFILKYRTPPIASPANIRIGRQNKYLNISTKAKEISLEKNFIIATISAVSNMVFFELVLRSNLEFNFTLPTSDKSYLSFLKYKLLNISSAISTDGASPGLKTL